jgi:hypothetical protein
MSIPNLYNKIKSYIAIDKSQILYFLVIIGVGISSFGLGRLSAVSKENQSKNLPADSYILGNTITQNEINDMNANQMGEKKYVASKNGKIYYSAGCSGAKRIKPENEVWFGSKEDAEKSGYKPSTSCN